MKKLITGALLFLFGFMQAQTIQFSEDFESIPLGVTSSTNNASTNWDRSSTLQYSGSYSDSATIVATGDTIVLTTDAFSTTGSSNVLLKFNHIAKIALFDGAYLEVSSDNGLNWTRLTHAEYYGIGYFGAVNDPRFNTTSYAEDWDFMNNATIPQNSWWKAEVFDLSYIVANTSQAKVRFVLYGSTSLNYGWLIDDIEVVVANYDLVPPVINISTSSPKNTTIGTGPFNVTATITDSSGVANAKLVYTVAGISDTVVMVGIGANDYSAHIPSYSYGTSICYKVISTDVLGNMNPGLVCINFVPIKDPNAPPSFPYDVAMHSVVDPAAIVLANISSLVNIRIENKGDSILTKAQIGWEIDGIAQTPFTWNGNLTNDVVSSVFSIGNSNYSPGNHDITFYAHSPNDSVDQQTSNDTVQMSIFACDAILSGIYTLGGSGADFASFSDLKDVLYNCGINGNTTIKVNPGIYNETMYFNGYFPGLDSLNTLTIVSATNNKNDVIFTNAQLPAFTHTLLFDSVSWITVKDISLIGTGAGSTAVVMVEENTHNITVDGCSIELAYENTYSFCGIYVNGGSISNISILNNHIEGGYYGIKMFGLYADHLVNIAIEGNTVKDYYRYGMELRNIDFLVVKNNEVTRQFDANNASSVDGMYISANSPTVESNKINLVANYGSKGIYFSSSVGTATQPMRVVNNMISIDGASTSSLYGIYCSAPSHSQFYHNSISLQTGSATNSYAFYTSGSNTTDVDIRNNVFAHFGQGVAFGRMSGTLTSLDYNTYYSNGLVIMKWAYSTGTPSSGGIVGIQAMSSDDANSIVADPNFYSIKNLHSFGSAINGVATPIASVLTDFDGDLRNTTTPDMGADEFSISSIDVGVLSVTSPLSVDTQDNVTPFEVVIKNYGSGAITSMTIKSSIDGVNYADYAWTGSLAYGQTDTVTIGSFTIPVGTYDIMAYTVKSGDTLNFNDTLMTTGFGLTLIDVEVVELVSPISGCGKTTSEEVQLRIKNNGVGYIYNGLSASYQLTGGTIVTESITDTLAPGSDIVYTFSQGVDISTGYQDSTYTITCVAHHNLDPNNMNDTSDYVVDSYGNLYAPIVSDTTINYGDSVTISASSTSPILWYENDSSTTVIGNGTYTTPLLFDTATYYAQANMYNPPATAYIGVAGTTLGFFDSSPYGVNMGSGRYQVLYTAAELIAEGVTAGELESLSFKSASSFSGPSMSMEISLANVSNTTLTSSFVSAQFTQVYYNGSSYTGTSGWNLHTFTTPFYWDGTSSLLVNICTVGNPYNAAQIYYSTTASTMVVADMGMGAGCASSQGLAGNKRPNIKIVKLGSSGCYSAKVPLVVNVPLPLFDARVSEIVNPKDACGLVSAEVTIDIENMGTDTIKGPFTATYRVDNGAYIAAETINDTILSGDTLRYTFNTLASLNPGATGTKYAITAKIDIPADTYSANDSLSSDSILSKYTPANPIVSDITIDYGDSAVLAASANDSVYWYADSLAMLYVGTAAVYVTSPIYDSTSFYAQTQRTIVATDYYTGTGTASSSYSGPSPYGAGGSAYHGIRMQFLITADELLALGMIQGPISSVSFDVTTMVNTPLHNYTIKMGHTDNTDMAVTYFENNMTTVYSNMAYSEQLGWNEHTFTTPFYWDGVSNVIVETNFKNNYGVAFSNVHYTPTSFSSVAYARGNTSFNVNDTIIDNNSSNRPNIRIKQTGLGMCKSDLMEMKVNVINYVNDDAALLSVVEPLNSASSIAPSVVKVVLRNYGLNTFSSATISWAENGVVQTPYSWTGSLAKGAVDTVTIASNHFFAGGETEIKTWVSLANDTVTSNDTTVSTIAVCMSGVYTINPSTGDYPSFTEAVMDLGYSGICGAVTFNVDSAVYGEQVVLYSVQGSSPTNTITFQSTEMDSTKAKMTYSTNVNQNFVFKIDGASYINIKHLGMSAIGSTDGNVIVLAGGAHHINILNNNLSSTISTTYNTKAANIVSYREDANHVLISNNNLMNGYKSIQIEGLNSDSLVDWTVSNNVITNFVRYGIDCMYANDIEIVNNTIISSPLNSSTYGIKINYNIDGLTISKNKIIMSAVSTTYGMYFTYSKSTSSNKAVISNNFVSSLAGTGGVKGVYCYGSEYMDIVYNSINLTSGNQASRAMELYGGNNFTVKNNSIATKFGYAIYVSTIPASSVVDYNNYYVDTLSSTKYVRWVGDISNLAALQAFDVNNNQNGLSIDPLYYSPMNLHTQQISMYSTGTPIVGITTDIDEDIRNTTTPCIGADEFTPPAIDLGVSALIHPSYSDCGYSAIDSIVVQIKNYGLNNINFASDNAEIKVIVSNAVVDTIIYTLNTGSVNSSDVINVKVSNNFDMSINGQYEFVASVTIANDGNAANDILDVQEVVSYPNINTFPFNESFESGTNISFKQYRDVASDISTNQAASYGSLYGLHFEGGSYTGWLNPNNVTQAFNNTTHVAKAVTCNVDATNETTLSLQFDLKQTRQSTYGTNTSWFRVMLIDANSVVHYLKNSVGDSVFMPTTLANDNFTRHTFSLVQYVGQNFQISFESANKYSFNYSNGAGDNAFVDNIAIWSPAPLDVSVEGIVSDNYFGKVGDLIQIKVAFSNVGSDTLYSIPMAYQADNGVIVRDTITGTFLPTERDTIAFSTYHQLAAGAYNICAFAELAGDAVAVNDTACKSFKGMQVYTVNYSDDFETNNDWLGIGSLNQWIQGEPNKTNITGANSGQNAWVTNLTSDYDASSVEYLYSPYFIIPSYAPPATVDFSLFVDIIANLAKGTFEYSFDGITWSSYGYMGLAGSVNWYNKQVNGQHVWAMYNTGWTYTSAPLDSATFNTGTPFQFRFKFESGSSTNTGDGMAIDDFNITIPPFAFDAGVNALITPSVSTSMGGSIEVKVALKNFGSTTLTSIPVKYEVDGSVVGSEIWTGSLAYNAVDTFTFTTTYTGPNQDYSICAYTSLSNEMQVHNDTACSMLIATAGQIDAGISAVLAPVGQTSIGKLTEVKVTIKNYGIDTLGNVPVEYFVNGSLIASEVSAPKIAPGDSLDHLFTTKYISGVGTYMVCSRTQVIGDADASNNQACVTVIGTSINGAEGDVFTVKQNQPNPANGNTSINIYLPQSGDVEFKLVNVLGSVIEEQELNYTGGNHEIIINTNDYPVGIYHYSVSFDGQVRTFKMVIVR
ncbi:MAG: T9SS type A sorting domain-containing protein [Bacteroidales bacterium]|nr:T9SS type A sorting domain-containing protein [Bacteroidales bacterium]